MICRSTSASIASNVGRFAGSARRAFAMTRSRTFRGAGSSAYFTMPGRSHGRDAISKTCVHGPTATQAPARQRPALSGAPRAPASQSPSTPQAWCAFVEGQSAFFRQSDGGGGRLFFSSPNASSCAWNLATLAA